jgi:hypothetical protein
MLTRPGSPFDGLQPTQFPNCDGGQRRPCVHLPTCFALQRSPPGVNRRQNKRAARKAARLAAKEERAAQRLSALVRPLSARSAGKRRSPPQKVQHAPSAATHYSAALTTVFQRPGLQYLLRRADEEDAEAPPDEHPREQRFYRDGEFGPGP